MKRIAMMLVLLSLPAAAAFAADAAAGKTIFDAKCKMCHGAAGAGGAMDKASIAGVPEPTTRSAVHVGKGKMVKMPSIIGDDLDNVAAYVASLKKQ
jgi:mono/diheme cytochrome c family protein